MRPLAVILVCVIGCTRSDDNSDADGPEDTDTPGDTDTDTSPAELDCPFEACGGDVVGDWTIDQVCVSAFQNIFLDDCSTSISTISKDTFGTYAIREDGTFDIDAGVSLSGTVTFPSECNTEKASCDEWEPLLDGLDCTGDVTVACECGLSYGPVPYTVSGEWAYAGEDLVFDALGQTTDGGPWSSSWDYCQDGDSLDLRLKGGESVHVLSR